MDEWVGELGGWVVGTCGALPTQHPTVNTTANCQHNSQQPTANTTANCQHNCQPPAQLPTADCQHYCQHNCPLQHHCGAQPLSHIGRRVATHLCTVVGVVHVGGLEEREPRVARLQDSHNSADMQCAAAAVGLKNKIVANEQPMSSQRTHSYITGPLY